MKPRYEPAQVCLHGHMTNDATLSDPEDNAPFCRICGAKTITHCQQCNAPVRGRRIREDPYESVFVGNRKPDAYCAQCGRAYPWTEEAIQAAIELLVETETVSSEEASKLQQDMADLTAETPRTPVAVHRFKGILAKATKPVGDALRNIVVGVITEAAKKQIWGP